VTCVAADFALQKAISGSNDWLIKVWDLQCAVCVATLAGHLDAVTCVSVDFAYGLCLSGSFDRTLKMWDLKAAVAPATFHQFRWSVDRMMDIWDLERGMDLATFRNTVANECQRLDDARQVFTLRDTISMDDTPNFIAYDAPTGQFVAGTGGTVMVYCEEYLHIAAGSPRWDWERFGAPMAMLEGHEGTVTCVSVDFAE
jgi:WD40 repeat protein